MTTNSTGSGSIVSIPLGMISLDVIESDILNI
jgi:hypothetical protein